MTSNQLCFIPLAISSVVDAAFLCLQLEVRGSVYLDVHASVFKNDYGLDQNKDKINVNLYGTFLESTVIISSRFACWTETLAARLFILVHTGIRSLSTSAIQWREEMLIL